MLATYDDLLRILKCQDSDVHTVFRTGSYLYGCANAKSDEDFVAVLHGGRQDLILRPKVNIVCHSPVSFQQALDSHSVFALECLYSPLDTRIKVGPSFSTRIDKARLKAKATETSDSDFNKAKRIFDSDWVGAKKKIYHSIRVLMFVNQIVTHGRITDYGEANSLRSALLSNTSHNWLDYDLVFNPLREALK